MIIVFPLNQEDSCVLFTLSPYMTTILVTLDKSQPIKKPVEIQNQSHLKWDKVS